MGLAKRLSRVKTSKIDNNSIFIHPIKPPQPFSQTRLAHFASHNPSLETDRKAGNPDTQPDIDIIIGPGTEIIASEGQALAPGGVNTHVHYICPQHAPYLPTTS